MAGPRIFVPGPGVNPNLIGSPAQYLSNIASIANNRRTNQTARERTANQKLFQDATLDLNTRKQEFAEAEPDRKKAEALYLREQGNLRAQEQLAALNNTGGSLRDQFISNPQTQEYFAAQGITDPAQQVAMVDEIIAKSAKNKKIFSDPNVQAKAAYEYVIQNKGTLAEAEAARNSVYSQWGTLDKDLAKSMMSTGNAGIPGGTGKNSIFGSSGKSGSAVQAAPSALDEEKLLDTTMERLKIENDRSTPIVDPILNWLGWGDPTRSTADVFDRDLAKADVMDLIGTYGGEYPTNAIASALKTIVNPRDGTVDQDKWRAIMADEPDNQYAEAFRTELSKQQRVDERTRGGSNPLAGMSSDQIFKFYSDAQAAQDSRNMEIASRTIPQADTFEDRFKLFRSATGQPNGAAAATVNQDNARQGGEGGSNTPSTSTGSAALDSLITPVGAQEGNSPGTAEDFNTPDQIFPNTAPPGTTPPGASLEISQPAFAGNQDNLDKILTGIQTGQEPFSQGPVSPDQLGKIFAARQAEAQGITEESISFGDTSIKVLRDSEGRYAIPSRPDVWYTKAELEKLAKKK